METSCNNIQELDNELVNSECSKEEVSENTLSQTISECNQETNVSLTKMNSHVADEICAFYTISDTEELIDQADTNFVYGFSKGSISEKSFRYLGYFGLTKYRAFFYNFYFSDLEKKRFVFPFNYVSRYTLEELKHEFALEIYLKDERKYKIWVSKKNRSVIDNFISQVSLKFNDLYILLLKSHSITSKLVNEGIVRAEMERQGLFDETERQKQLELVTPFLSLYNDNYSLISTYPISLVIAKDLSEDNFVLLSHMFVNRRLPIMTWTDRINQASLWITSSFTGSSTLESLAVLKEYLTSMENRSIKGSLDIVDLQLYKNNSLSSYFKGQLTKYSLTFKCRNQYLKMMSLEQLFNDQYAKRVRYNLETSEWLDLVSEALKIAVESSTRISVRVNIYIIKEGYSVLIQSDEGRERAILISSLTQIMLDGYFRTIKGFVVLIEKEWIQLGYPFSKRNVDNWIEGPKDIYVSTDFNPLFILFLDCVHQLVMQFPAFFEFKLLLLEEIAFHSYSCRFFNFLKDCEKERSNEGLLQYESLWDTIAITRINYLNPLYSPECISSQLISANYGIFKLILWESHYFKYSKDNMPIRVIEERKLNDLKILAGLKDKINDLRKAKIELQDIITGKGIKLCKYC